MSNSQALKVILRKKEEYQKNINEVQELMSKETKNISTLELND